MSKTFKAYRIHEIDKKIVGRFEQLTLDDLAPGNVVVRVLYSDINYKDALAATGAGRILRKYPLVGGIDFAGVVEASTDARYKPGDPVLVTGCGLSETHDGGYAEYARIPAAWVVPMPKGLNLFDAMALGPFEDVVLAVVSVLEVMDVPGAAAEEFVEATFGRAAAGGEADVPFAEAARLPFDLPECEQELVGGYHTEYSGIKLLLFLVAEFLHMITGAFLIAILFLGGWHFWGLTGSGDNVSWFQAILRIGVLMAKVFVVIVFFVVQALDGALTYLGLHTWGPSIEANPLVKSAVTFAGRTAKRITVGDSSGRNSPSRAARSRGRSAPPPRAAAACAAGSGRAAWGSSGS